MHIDRVTIRNFLAFAKADITLAPGFNVILAPNEGGKSSLMRAIIIGLYQDASSRKRELVAMRHWGSETFPRIELRIEIGGERLRIVRDFDEHKQYLYHGDDTDHFSSGRDVDRYLGEVLVVSDERLFVRVCGVHQEELARVADGRIDLGERIEEILSGGWGRMNPAQVRGEIEELRAELHRGLDHPAKRENWGPLKRYTEEMKGLERSLGEARSVEERRAALLRALSEARHERDRIGLGLLTEQKERAGEYTALHRTVEEAEERMRDLQRRRERIEKLQAERERLRERGNGFPTHLPGCGAGALDGIRRDLEREDILRREIEAHVEQAAVGPPLARLIAGAVLIAGGVAGWVRWGIAFAAVAALGLVLVVWTLARRRGEGGAELSAERREELDRLERARREWAADGSLDESREMLRAFQAWRHELHELDARLQEMVRGHNGARRAEAEPGGIDSGGISEKGESETAILESLNDQFMRLSAQWHASRGKLEALEPFRLDAADLLRLEETIDRTERQVRELDGRIASLERELMALPQGDVNLTRERLASAREACERARRRSAIIDIIIETLDEARGAVAGFLAERLPPLAGRYLSVITGGRYGAVYIDPVTARVEVAPATDDGAAGREPGAVPERIPPGALSQGARDQIYFAVRLAIVELLGGREPQPLLLDDPFVHFDPERGERALELIREFSERHQVLLFSCDPRYEQFGGTVIRF